MYWYPSKEASRFQSGFNICSARLYVLRFDLFFCNKECHLSARDSFDNFLKLLEEPLYLACGNELPIWEFINILHALQVVQLYYWKASELETAKIKGLSIDIVPLSELQQQKINYLKVVLLKDL